MHSQNQVAKLTATVGLKSARDGLMTLHPIEAICAGASVLSVCAPLCAQTLPSFHRLPATLAFEAVGEAVAACTAQGHRVSASVINPDGVRIATLHGDGSGQHTLDASYAKAYAAVSF